VCLSIGNIVREKALIRSVSGLSDRHIARRLRVLDPIDRISEVLFGLVMVLTCTGTLSVMTAGRAEVKTMMLAALGCNLAWGIIDAGLYVMGCLEERGRSLLTMRSIQQTSDADAGRRAIAEVLPQSLAPLFSQAELESVRQTIKSLPASSQGPRLTWDDILGGVAICLIVFLSTVPVIVPFLFIDDVRPALRVSNAVAIGMLFMCGYAFAQCTGLRPWSTGIAMVAVGCLMVGVAIMLGG
jgi:hypothetical protein